MQCLFKNCKHCIIGRNLYNVDIPEKDFLDINKLNIVKSAFGCISLLRTDIYNKVCWGDSVCEHHSFCEQISQ